MSDYRASTLLEAAEETIRELKADNAALRAFAQDCIWVDAIALDAAERHGLMRYDKESGGIWIATPLLTGEQQT